ncbi:hypothetical protein NAT51_04125 [Flavobacterium amniphilum]|uniref:hypothetical protein n=1 Tax=Flavobacterium amniphilum TaxID=1834035 RepID=UPI00202A4978|nr:hypothetical protein [Flavobacterium amniphilum]MCL9804695.1 hypothetical protein [Flavobacterium amniphilum]
MTVELIPVLEVGYNNPGIPTPDKYPYWEYSEVWTIYNSDCYKKAGFIDDFKPYLEGSSFYRLHDITNNNLTKLTIDHTKELREGEYKRPQDTCSFSGGYVLRIDGEDKYFPQCCGELSDIKYWENISNGRSSYHEEHPAPQVKFDAGKIIFNFSTEEHDEPFQPTPPEIILSVDRLELKKAVEKAIIELQNLEQRLTKINEVEKLNIDDIGGLLIWDNTNYE